MHTTSGGRHSLNGTMKTPLPFQCPYNDLFIYYLKGRIASDSAVAGPGYIGNWEEEEDSFLFFRQPADVAVQSLIYNQTHLTLVDQFHMAYDDWQGGALMPIRIGGLRVVPPWHEAAHDIDSESLLLDPGVVFGTGTHPTTQDCLTAMQMAFDQQPVERVLDLGTGTGLLALASIRLGARHCVAVDLNRLAVETAYHNVQLNHMAGQILVVQGNAKNFMDLACDLMISNIHYDVMRHLIVAPGFRTRKQFILSGLLRSQARDIEQQLRQGPGQILHKWSQEGIWYTFYGRCGP